MVRFRRILLCTAAICLLVGSVRAADTPTPGDILTRQQAYFQSIRSIEFYSTLTYILGPEMIERMREEGNEPREKIEQGLRLFVEGDKFRAEATLENFQTRETFTGIHAFDGEHYQLRFEPEEPVMQPVLMLGRPYLAMDPLTSICAPAMADGEEASLATFRGDAFWQRLSGMIVGSEEIVWDGRAGTALKLVIPNKIGPGTIPVEVFFAEDTGYAPPLRWRLVRRGPETNDREIVEECRIAETTAIATESGQIHIPTRFEARSFEAGKAFGPSEVIEIDPASLKVNHDVDDGVFTVAGARVYQTASGPPLEENPEIALAVITAFYDDAIAQLSDVLDPVLMQQFEHMPEWMREGTPKLLADRLGRPTEVELLSAGQANQLALESVWAAKAEGRDFQMRLSFMNARVSSVSVRLLPEQEWSPLPQAGIAFIVDSEVPPGW